MPPRRSPRRRVTGLVVLAVLAVGVGAYALHRSPSIVAACTARAGGDSFTIDPDQAENATIIAAEAQRQGLPNHAVSVGLAAALQESKLQNLSFGDRDSLGLFQQRPSQGWGTPAQLMDPTYAARAFYRGLRKVHGWQDLPIYLAAQRVQHSADATAYAAWDTEARTLARGLTGETPAGFGCRFPSVAKATVASRARTTAAITTALGPSALLPGITPARGWLVASWIMSRAPAYRVHRITFAGWTWTPRSGWRPSDAPGPAVTFA